MNAVEESVLGRYGRLHKTYLMQNKPQVYQELSESGKIDEYLLEIDRQARCEHEMLMESFKKTERITEELKQTDQLQWVQSVMNIWNRVEEIVLAELIYV